jgi:hypothetical protein
VVAAFLAYQSNPGAILAWVYVAVAVIRLLAIMLVKYVPEQRGAW